MRAREKARAEGRYGILILQIVRRRLLRDKRPDRLMVNFIDGLIVGQQQKVTRNGGKP